MNQAIRTPVSNANLKLHNKN